METSYQPDGAAGLTTVVVGCDINPIINHKVRHFKKLAAAPLITKLSCPSWETHTHTVLKQSPAASLKLLVKMNFKV